MDKKVGHLYIFNVILVIIYNIYTIMIFLNILNCLCFHIFCFHLKFSLSFCNFLYYIIHKILYIYIYSTNVCNCNVFNIFFQFFNLSFFILF